MSNSPGFRGGAVTSAIPKSLSSSPYSGVPRQRTSQLACVRCFLPSSSIHSSFSKKVANPFGAIFGSLITNHVALRTRGELPISAASRSPSALLLRKLCSRKKAAPTIAYVALKLGQRRTSKAQITTSTEIARRVDGERGKQSAKITPIAATTARPTNGWRGPLNNFIVRFSSISRGQRKLFSARAKLRSRTEHN